MLFDAFAFALDLCRLASAGRRELACLHELADISGMSQRHVHHHGPRVHVRLQKPIAALELLVFVLDDFDAVNDFHKASLERFGLSGENGLA